MRRMALVGVMGAVFCFAGCGSGAAPTRTYRQPSASMLPTLKIGQRVSVSVNPHYVPKLGDIVVFHPPAGADAAVPVCGNSGEGAGHRQACDAPTPKESAQTFIKRVVALPGDSIMIKNGHVFRNGALEEDSGHTLPCGAAPTCDYPVAITIPPGDYFLLGDNRGESDDSRFWGPVPRAWIIGKVIQP